MIRATRTVRNAAAKPFFRFRYDDAPIRTFPVQLEAKDGAAETAANDNNGFGGGSHGWVPICNQELPAYSVSWHRRVGQVLSLSIYAAADERIGIMRSEPKVRHDAFHRDLFHDMTRPPATSRVAPVIQEEAEDRRKSVAAATSRG
jgi:hypothetical protein